MSIARLLGSAAPAMVLCAATGVAQIPQNRISQQIVVNGQTVGGAYVMTAGGEMQSFTCSSPQQYATPNGSSRGWACFDQASGTWLLNAVPPAPASAPVVVPAPAPQVQAAAAPPPVVYQAPATVIYQQPAVIYTAPVYPVRPVIVNRVYHSDVLLGAAAINATGRIVAAALSGPRYWDRRYTYRAPVRFTPQAVHRHRY